MMRPVRTAEAPHPPKIAALILAAGRSQRMGENKLLILLDRKPVLAIVADQVLASRASPVIVVTGHDADATRMVLGNRPVMIIDNRAYQDGLSASVRAGIAALDADIDAVVICLGDMPGVTTDVIDRLIAGFDVIAGAEIVAPSYRGQRGNPVLWGRRFFPALQTLTGDTGGKPLIAAHPQWYREIVVEEPGVLIDIDTPAALAAYRAQQKS